MQKDTSKLNEILNSTGRDALPGFFKENNGEMLSASLSARSYIRELAALHKMKLDDIYTRAGMSLSYGRKIASGKTVKKRDTVIRLCLALRTSLPEANLPDPGRQKTSPPEAKPRRPDLREVKHPAVQL